MNPDTKQIEWTKGAPPNKIAAAAQEYVLSRGKYDIAAAKKQMSILGGTREAEEEAKGEGGKLGGASNLALGIATAVDILTGAYRRSQINNLEGTTGFHLGIDGSVSVTNLQKFGDTFGVGATVTANGLTFKLTDSGTWTNSSGDTLTQDKNGKFHIRGPSA